MDENTLNNLRKNYQKGELLESQINPNPLRQFEIWFEEVFKSNIYEPNAMILATSSGNKPSARVVLLKGFDERGFKFYTNYNSRKGRELTSNPNAALLFYWMELERQVRIEGRVEKLSKEESLEYFNSRPLESRYGALASNQSEVIPNREFLERKFFELKEKYGDNPPMPESWGGFLLIPELFEFWQGRPGRLHDRIVYEKSEKSWKIYRLSP
ncbi:pyridoxamine 5'-phosphate oxidase [Ignavibacterium album JCM 16511]|uniref:Pyridoxamine 5'-phosphate oxidase n=1 Tax=Ignavibacterium album (strain DSM 19864 / JCM 16511 / NBRC 101810 / Mat9-16) TaxID=945713 RepID=I0AIZ7_IGNAJ|nr:pyridoxamine 5'-phosphate oxidase [Ignavibacterium album]AFH48954.1 pyridoxamine 5'-phosphate oxidase [Ignavibacterium album JCM 16511]